LLPSKPKPRRASSYNLHDRSNRTMPIRYRTENPKSQYAGTRRQRPSCPRVPARRSVRPEKEGAMTRFYACMISAVLGLHAIALAQDTRLPAPALQAGSIPDARIAAPIPPPAALPPASIPPTTPGVYRLTLEDAQRIALANNTSLSLGAMNVQEKLIAVAAARTDYFPKLLGNFLYFRFSDNLGEVATFQRGRLGLLPPSTRVIQAVVANQDSA